MEVVTRWPKWATFLEVCLLCLYFSYVAEGKSSQATNSRAVATEALALDSLFQNYKKVSDRMGPNHSATKKARLHLAKGLYRYNYLNAVDSIFETIDSSSLQTNKLRIDYAILQGRLLRHEGNRREALSYFYQHMNDAGKLQLAEIYLEVASLLRANSDLINCTKFYRLAEKQAEKYGDVGLQVKANMQLCKVYNGWVTLNLDSSVFYGQKAIDIATEAGDQYWITHAAAMAAAPMIRNGDKSGGKQLSKTALLNADKHGLSDLTRYYLLINLGFIYADEDQYDSAIYYQKESAMLRPQGIDHHRLRYYIFKKQGRYREALESLETFRSIYDSARDRRHQTKITTLQARLETQQKEQQVQSLSQMSAIQQLQIDQQRIYLYGLVVLVLFISLGGYFFFLQRKQREEQKRTNLEQKLLRLQMNPHFIYNALASIQNFVLQQDPVKASGYLTKFSRLMRKILEYSREEYITLEEELELIENYVNIQQLRFPHVRYEVNVDESIDPRETLIPPMFVQPFIENSFEHGLANIEGQGKIEISFSQKSGDLLQVSLTDNGKGIDRTLQSEHKSLAIQITNERLLRYSKDIRQKLQVVTGNLNDLDASSKGTAVSLLMPYK